MNTNYSISTDIRFSPLELIDIKRIQQETRDQWRRASCTARARRCARLS